MIVLTYQVERVVAKVRVYITSTRRCLVSFGRTEIFSQRLLYLSFAIHPKVSAFLNRVLRSAIDQQDLNRLILLSRSVFDTESVFALKRSTLSGIPRNGGHSPVEVLAQKGFLKWEKDLRGHVTSVMGNLAGQRLYPSNVPIGSPDGRKVTVTNRWNYYCTDPLPKFLLPALSELLSDASLRETIGNYLGGAPVIYSVNSMLTVSSRSSHSVTDLHRDFDDYHFLSLFIYWTQVTSQNGATRYVQGSHIGTPLSDRNQCFLEGTAGDVFLVDPYGLHAGNKATELRFVTWVRFGVKRWNLASLADKSYLCFEDFRSLFPLYREQTNDKRCLQSELMPR